MGLKRTPTQAPGNLAPRQTAQPLATYNGAHELIPGFGPVTVKDRVIPRLKLLQGLSPEVKENSRKFFPGEWYHNTLGEMLGKTMPVVPLQIIPTIELWAPRDSGEGLLARSVDRLTWDKPNTKFRVRLKGREITWDTRGSVAQSGLDQFGTSDPQNPKSPPAASLTYRLVLWLIDEPELSPCMYIASRMASNGIKDLIGRVHMRWRRKTPFYAQKYDLIAAEMIRGPNQFYVPSFRNAGEITDPDLLGDMRGLAESMRSMNIRTDDERPDHDEAGHAAPDKEAYSEHRY